MIDRYTLHDQYLSTQDSTNYDQTIVNVPHPVVSLRPNIMSADKPSTIVVSLYLSTLDRENAVFIINHAKEINELL